jgi:mRNA-degrading endonuclease RelE of RelBE toxin-antitoxin system
MARRQTFLTAAWSEQWKESYAELPAERQATCDRAVIALIKRESPPGLRVKPIQPEEYYLEARISGGDRIIFRIEAETVYFIDVVKHDDIERYSHRAGRR